MRLVLALAALWLLLGCSPPPQPHVRLAGQIDADMGYFCDNQGRRFAVFKYGDDITLMPTAQACSELQPLEAPAGQIYSPAAAAGPRPASPASTPPSALARSDPGGRSPSPGP